MASRREGLLIGNSTSSSSSLGRTLPSAKVPAEDPPTQLVGYLFGKAAKPVVALYHDSSVPDCTAVLGRLDSKGFVLADGRGSAAD